MSGEPLVALSGISRVYGTGSARVRALDDIELLVEPGTFLALMGPSGSGKSTCLNVLGCLDEPTSGSYRFLGTEVTGLSSDQRARLRRTYLGFVFQGFNLLPRTTAIENVELPLIYRGLSGAERRRLAMAALDDVGLANRAHHGPNELSGGEQQRVALARALVSRPRLLLADEPTGNLDSATGHEVMALLRTLNSERDITVLMVTHDPTMAEYAHETVRFLDGHVLDRKRPELPVRSSR